MANTNLLGDDFKLYVDTADDFSTPTWSEITDIGNMGLDPAKVQVEIPKRGMGHKVYKSGRKDTSLTFELSLDLTNTDHTKLRDAIDAGTAVHLAIASGAIATTGTIYHHGWFLLTGPEDYSLDAPATISVEGRVHADTVLAEIPAKVTVS